MSSPRLPSPRRDGAEHFTARARASYDALTGHAGVQTVTASPTRSPLIADRTAAYDHIASASSGHDNAHELVPAILPTDPGSYGGSYSARSEKNLQWSEDAISEPPLPPSSARGRHHDYDASDRMRARSASPRTPRSVSSASPSPRLGGGSSTPRNGAASPRTPRLSTVSTGTPRLWSPRSTYSDAYESDGGKRSDPIERIPLDFNIFFQNARLAPLAPRQSELSPKHALPEEIFFYLHVSTYPTSFPLPHEYPQHQYLHRASVYVGHEAAGPAVQMRFNPSTVIGLKPHHMTQGKCTQQLVLVVPVTRRVNAYLAPKSLTFQPSLHSQLHSSQHLPRVVVPITPLGLSGQASKFTTTFVKNTKKIALKALVCPWESSPRGQRLHFAISRWKKVCDAIYTDTAADAPDGLDLSDATVGTPYRFGEWFPRAALDVPSYTTVYFQNGRVSMAAPQPRHLPHRHLLPRDIYFYVRTKTCEVPFPLPEKDYPSSKYLHLAKVIPGHEAGGPTAHMLWNIHTVVGLKKHHCGPTGAPHRAIQMVIVVPSTPHINPGVEPAQLAFSPFNFAQLHLSRRLPRIIVPLFPRTSFNEITRHVDTVAAGERLQKLKTLMGAWEKMARRDLKRASFCRWVRVCADIEVRVGYKPPAPQIGSPFVELLADRGEHTDLARWPRLERAQQLFNTGGVDNPELRMFRASRGVGPGAERSPHQSHAAQAHAATLQLESHPALALDVEAAQRLQRSASPRRSLSPCSSARRYNEPQPSSARRYSEPQPAPDQIMAERQRAMYGSGGEVARSSSAPRLRPHVDSARGTLTSTIPYTPRSAAAVSTSQANTPRSASPLSARERAMPSHLTSTMLREQERLLRQEQAMQSMQEQHQLQGASPRIGSPRMGSPRMGSPRRIHERA